MLLILIFSSNPCYKAMLTYFESAFNTTGAILISIASVFGLMVIMTCCLCCHPNNSNKGSDYYTRLAYTADWYILFILSILIILICKF